MKKIKETSLKLIKTGLNPSKIAIAITIGIAVGIFPILGPFSFACAGIALLFGLNIPVALASYYSMTFIQPVLIIPYLRVGEFVFQSDPMTLSLVELSKRFAADAPGTLAEFGWSFLHATVGWVILLPVLLVLLYPFSLNLVSRWQKDLTRKQSVLAALCISAVAFTPDANAWLLSSDKHPFPEAVRVSTNELTLTGTGTLKYKKIIPVYDAALYRGIDGSKRLAVSYRVNADAEQFINAGADILKRNYDSETLRSMQPKLDRFNAWYPDTQKGDICSITFIPGEGIELVYNGISRGTIKDDAFARFYFSIWLGEDPASTKLKEDLLGDRQS